MKNSILNFALIILLFSCSKDDTTQPETPISKAVKVKTITNGSSISTFTYDLQGRLLKKEDQGGEKLEYVYGNNSITENRYNASGTLLVTYALDLNADGLVTKATLTYPNTLDHLLVYTYNANKQVATIKSTSSTSFNFNYIDTYGYLSKSVDNIVRTQLDGTLYRTTYFDYYFDKINSLSNKNIGMSFYAEESNLPVKTMIVTYSATNSTTYNYMYEFDAKNRISKKIINSGVDGINDIAYY